MISETREQPVQSFGRCAPTTAQPMTDSTVQIHAARSMGLTAEISEKENGITEFWSTKTICWMQAMTGDELQGRHMLGNSMHI